MSNAFAPIVRARPCPIFGRPVHLWVAPRLRPDTSPQTLRIPDRSGHPVLQTPSSGQRGITPVFGSSFEHRRDFNPPDSRAAQRTLRGSPPLPSTSVLSASRFLRLCLFP